MSKIRILRIIARLNIGGPAINTVLLTEGLNNARFESLLVYGSLDKDEGDMFYYARQKNINSIFLPELKRQLNFYDDIVAFAKIYAIIKAKRPDIIHSHTAKAGTLGRLAGLLYNLLHFSKGRRIKLVHTFHGHIFDGYFNKFKTMIFVFIERFLASFTCMITTVSESLKEELISLRISRNSKIKVIPLGLELERFLEILPSENSVLNIGIVGRLVPIKNHRLFLEAAAKMLLGQHKIQLRFKIVGDGQLRQDLERYAEKLNILNSVDFLGWQEDLVSIYSGLDVVALTSINEGTPVSLIEAMAAGRAVVATDVGGVRDLLGREIYTERKPDSNFKVMERGIMAKSQDAFNFASALKFIIQSDTLRKDMGQHARNFVKERFIKNRLIKDMEDLYEGLLVNSV